MSGEERGRDKVWGLWYTINSSTGKRLVCDYLYWTTLFVPAFTQTVTPPHGSPNVGAGLTRGPQHGTSPAHPREEGRWTHSRVQTALLIYIWGLGSGEK